MEKMFYSNKKIFSREKDFFTHTRMTPMTVPMEWKRGSFRREERRSLYYYFTLFRYVQHLPHSAGVCE